MSTTQRIADRLCDPATPAKRSTCTMIEAAAWDEPAGLGGIVAVE
jgi:hypothetical protein